MLQLVKSKSVKSKSSKCNYCHGVWCDKLHGLRYWHIEELMNDLEDEVLKSLMKVLERYDIIHLTYFKSYTILRSSYFLNDEIIQYIVEKTYLKIITTPKWFTIKPWGAV